MRSHTHSPARLTSSACAESALTLGMRRNSESSSSQSCCTVVRYFPVATAAAQPMTGRTAWARAGGSSYDTFWAKDLSIRVGGSGISESLRGWINDGLMVFFFLVAGLEARRELDMGELRQRRRIALPLVAASGG